jgi:hypothetical protein
VARCSGVGSIRWFWTKNGVIGEWPQIDLPANITPVKSRLRNQRVRPRILGYDTVDGLWPGHSASSGSVLVFS